MLIERATGDTDPHEGFMIWAPGLPGGVHKTAADAHIYAAQHELFMPPIVRRRDVAFSKYRGYYLPVSFPSLRMFVEQDAEVAAAVDRIWETRGSS